MKKKLNKKVYFEDNGQDFSYFVIQPDGMIIDCGPFQASIWMKWHCITKRFRTGGFLHLQQGEDTMFMKHRIEKIEDIRPFNFIEDLKSGNMKSTELYYTLTLKPGTAKTIVLQLYYDKLKKNRGCRYEYEDGSGKALKEIEEATTTYKKKLINITPKNEQ